MLEVRKIPLDSTVIQVPGSIVTNMGGDKVMMNVQQGKYYNLGETGGVIWELLQNPLTIKEIINKMVAQYTVDEIECQEHVISFLDNLRNEELIQIID